MIVPQNVSFDIFFLPAHYIWLLNLNTFNTYWTVFVESGVKHHQVKQTNTTVYNHTLGKSLLPIITD